MEWSKDLDKAWRPAAKGRKPRPGLGFFFIGNSLRKVRLRSPQVRHDSSGTGNVISVPTVGVEEMHLDKMTSNMHFAIRVKFNTLCVVSSQRST